MFRPVLLTVATALALAPAVLPQAAPPKPAEIPAPKAPAAGAIREFHLYSVDGDWELADGNSTYVMGFSTWDDAFGKAPEPLTKEAKAKLSERLTVPGPEIRVKVGDKVRVWLHNSGLCCAKADSHLQRTTHTIHFHGLDLLAPIDGVPDLPVKAVEEGKEFAYDFVPDFEGTYMYHCHVDSATHMLLGMYGALIVEGPEPKTIYGHKYDREYTLFLSEMDTKHNEAMRNKGSYNMLDWKSDYFLLNGRIFVSNLTNPLSTVNDPKSRLVCKVGETVLLRVLAMGNNHTFALHPHAYHMKVIGTDGRGLTAPYEKDTLPVVSGEKYDVLVKIGPKHLGLCQSCNIGAGVSIIHDHNMRGMTSDGKYPQGGLTIFEVKE
jgi:FtsP/CotA-like multicopper oxidase with cupredoxin domain